MIIYLRKINIFYKIYFNSVIIISTDMYIILIII